MLIFVNELASAGITDPDLIEAFAACRKLNAEHGKTYFLATRLLPKAKRPFVHALYGFARYADEIVDDLNLPISDQARSEKFESWQAQVRKDLHRGKSEDPIIGQGSGEFVYLTSLVPDQVQPVVEEQVETRLAKGERRVSPFLVPMMMANVMKRFKQVDSY